MNAILCLKVLSRVGMQASVDREWFANCASRFLRPTIHLVAPTAVVTLGEHPFRSLCNPHRIRPERFCRAVEADATRLPSGPLLVPVYHCGARILNTHRPPASSVGLFRIAPYSPRQAF